MSVLLRPLPRLQGGACGLRSRSSPKNLAGTFAVVTGAAQGIGDAIANPLAREGAAVALADLNLSEAQGVEAEIRNDGGTSRALPMDVIHPGSSFCISVFPTLRHKLMIPERCYFRPPRPFCSPTATDVHCGAVLTDLGLLSFNTANTPAKEASL